MDATMREIYTTSIAKTISTMVDNLESAKDSLLSLNLDDILDEELSQVQLVFMTTNTSIQMISEGLKILVAASKTGPQETQEDQR